MPEVEPPTPERVEEIRRRHRPFKRDGQREWCIACSLTHVGPTWQHDRLVAWPCDTTQVLAALEEARPTTCERCSKPVEVIAVCSGCHMETIGTADERGERVAELERKLEEAARTVCNFKAASMLVRNPADITPADVEQHIIGLSAEVATLTRERDEAQDKLEAVGALLIGATTDLREGDPGYSPAYQRAIEERSARQKAEDEAEGLREMVKRQGDAARKIIKMEAAWKERALKAEARAVRLWLALNGLQLEAKAILLHWRQKIQDIERKIAGADAALDEEAAETKEE